MSVAKALTKRGHIKLGDAVFDVFVLDNGMRVCTQRTLVKSLGGSGGGDLVRNLGKKLAAQLELGDPVRFDMLDGIQANGWRVGEIGKLCAQIIELQMAGVLPPERIDLARAANRLNGALAGIALEALVDEACDYQSVRDGDFLRKRLQFALREEADEWNRLWKKSNVRALCLVYGKTYDGGRHPQWLAAIMHKIHRWALGKEVAASLKERNPEPHFKSSALWGAHSSTSVSCPPSMSRPRYSATRRQKAGPSGARCRRAAARVVAPTTTASSSADAARHGSRRPSAAP